MKTRILSAILLLLTAALPAAHAHAGAGESMAATVRLNVRGGPGIDHPILDTLKVGERVFVNDCRGDWCRITHVGIDGWVFEPYLASAGVSQTWRATSEDLPATVFNDTVTSPDIGVTVEVEQGHGCGRTHPFC